MSELRIAGIVDDSVVDGPGVRLTVFTQGCAHHCEGCHNPETWDPQGGKTVTVDEIVDQYKENPLLAGITFSGGEPFYQIEPLAELADRIHELGGTVWCYTGYTMEELDEFCHAKKLLDKIDTLVDGEFVIGERDLSLFFRGSRNQRIWVKDNGKWRIRQDEEGLY